MRRFIRRTRAIAYKELIHMIRDVRVVYLALGLPLVMLALFGYAVSLDVDHISIAVVDQDGTRASRRVAEALLAGGAFVREADRASPEEAEPLFRRGRIKAVLVVPRGYQRDLARGAASGAQLLVDGSDGTVASIAMGDALSIVQSLSFDGRQAARGSLYGEPPIRTRFNPAMRSAYGIVPGVMVMILGMVSTLLTALTVAREWERGNMEQLFATPVSRTQIVIGKLIPYAVLGFIQTLLILTLGSYLFDVPIAGSVTMLFGSSLLFLLCMLGVGLLVSVATRSQLVSVQFSAMLGYMPAMLLSGFLFPIANMPWWLRGISSIFPARYYLDTLRGVMLKGNGLEVLAFQVLALAAFAATVLALAVAKFRRRLA
jgi:drug efflux transport system permease protein